MITGYIEYKFKRTEAKKDLEYGKKHHTYVSSLIGDLQEIEEFEFYYPECYRRYEEEVVKTGS